MVVSGFHCLLQLVPGGDGWALTSLSAHGTARGGWHLRSLPCAQEIGSSGASRYGMASAQTSGCRHARNSEDHLWPTPRAAKPKPNAQGVRCQTTEIRPETMEQARRLGRLHATTGRAAETAVRSRAGHLTSRSSRTTATLLWSTSPTLGRGTAAVCLAESTATSLIGRGFAPASCQGRCRGRDD